MNYFIDSKKKWEQLEIGVWFSTKTKKHLRTKKNESIQFELFLIQF